MNVEGTKPESRAGLAGDTPESRTSGDDLADEISAYCHAHDISLNEFGRRAGLTSMNLQKLRGVRRVAPGTVQRTRRFIAGEKFEPSNPVAIMDEMRRRSDGLKAARRPGESVADIIRRIGREVEGEVEEREENRDYQDVRTPSALLQRAKADWPEQYAKVRAYAVEQGIQPCEAWRRVIVAGIKELG